MKVRLLKIMAGPEIEAAYPGDVIEVPDKVGTDLVSSLVAERVAEAGEEKPFLPAELEVKAKETKSKGKAGKHEKMLATDPRSELL